MIYSPRLNGTMAAEEDEYGRRPIPELIASFPKLGQLDSLLRCPICYECFQEPVLTKCSHNFCSICVRKFLIHKQQCPSCLNPLYERDLVPNRILRDLVSLLTDPTSDKVERKSPSPGPSNSESVKQTVKPVTKPVYHLLKDSELKKKLREEGLDTRGDRKTLINRHQDFVILWNSECTKQNPRSKADILTRLKRDEHERAKVKTADIRSVLSQYDRNTDPKIIEDKQKDYLKANKSSFQKLILNAKQTRKEDVKREDSPARPATQPNPSFPTFSSPKSSSLYLTPKRKTLKNSPDARKNLRQNSVKTLFEKTQRQKVSCPSCGVTVTATFLNTHLDRCLDISGSTTRMRAAVIESSDEDDDFQSQL